MESLHGLFQLPLLMEAYAQYSELDIFMQSPQPTDANDAWTYVWGTRNYSSVMAYRLMSRTATVHPTLKWTWKAKCKTKHKVFFWLLLQDRLNTRGMLKKYMYLDSYVCEMCIRQREESL
jgi:hypothetical protein